MNTLAKVITTLTILLLFLVQGREESKSCRCLFLMRLASKEEKSQQSPEQEKSQRAASRWLIISHMFGVEGEESCLASKEENVYYKIQ